MAYEPWQTAVLQRYGILDQHGKPLMVRLKTLGDRPDGPEGPKVDPEVINRLFLADTTPDHKWTALDEDDRSWVFFQAGGGEAAVAQSDGHVDYMGKRYAAKYGDDKWEAAQVQFGLTVGKGRGGSADQDVCQKMRGAFGYYRNWPGRDNVYEHVVVQLTTFLKQYRKLLEMNKNVPPEKSAASEPSRIKTWQVMREINKKVSDWVAAKRVRTDFRLATNQQESSIYRDDYIMAIVPLTYGAAVKYGWEKWDVADPEKFASVSQGDIHGNPWDAFVGSGGLVVYLQFMVPVPWWIKRNTDSDSASYANYGLENLLLSLPKGTVQNDPNTWKVVDEESNEHFTIAQMKDMIRHEAARGDAGVQPPADAPTVRGENYKDVPHPAYQSKPTFPIARGAQVVNKNGKATNALAADAEDIIAHLDLCLVEIQRWAKKFRGKTSLVVQKGE